jgi:hypothetical protein
VCRLFWFGRFGRARSRTTIADRDAVRLGLNYEELSESQTPVIGVGCTAIRNYLLREVLLGFHVSGGSFQIESLPAVTVLRHEPHSDEEEE